MMAETVDMVVEGSSPYVKGLVRVEATFFFRNLGEQTEEMNVGFPLDQDMGWGSLCESGTIPFQPITDLTAWVNGKQVETNKYYKIVGFPPDYTPQEVPCWEYFPVIFPAGKDVTIHITYTGEPYHGKALYEYSYRYVLETGAGWYGTIGKADITIHIPYDLNDYSYLRCWPEPCAATGNQIEWHLEDFEPEYSSNISASFLPPPLWQRILTERANTELNPQDGEAWGRLAKAYKESILAKRGFRFDPAGKEMYAWSEAAYQKAVTLLPDDPDWHYGYAELLYNHALWGFVHDPEPNIPAWQACMVQLKQTLDLQPDHPKAHELLQEIAELEYAITLVDLSRPQPDYLVLTPQPATDIVTPTERPKPRGTLPPLNLELGSTATNPLATPRPLPQTVTASPGQPVRLTPTPTATPTSNWLAVPARPLGLGLIILLLLAGSTVLVVRWYNKRNL